MSRLQGLAGLLSVDSPVTIEPTATLSSNLIGSVPILIPISRIKRSPFQPRSFFNPDKIDKMAASFRKYRERGDFPKTAVLVRSIKGTDCYELIFGEQRKIAHEKAGFTEILAFVDNTITDNESRELALTENLLREDLNPIEKTEAILNLAAVRLKCTGQEVKQLLDKIANERRQTTDNVVRSPQWQTLEAFFQELPGQINPESFRAHYLPLLNLPKDILNAIQQGKLEYTKARAIASIKDDKQRQQLLQLAVEQNLSIREIRAQIRLLKKVASEAQSLSASGLMSLSERFDQLNKQIRKSKVCEDPKRSQQIQSLLDKVEKLLENS